MKIRYNVLWVENERDWLDSIQDEIKDFVEDRGFNFICDIASGKSAISNSGYSYSKYDLILMDLNLATEPTGDQIIQEIRDCNIYTDVILYSANGISATREKGRERELDGVYYSGRQADLFIKKVQQVINTTIRKTQDLANVRGLVMAEVSELDVKMGDILTNFLDSKENLKRFHQKVTSDREKSLHKSLEHPVCKKDCTLTLRKSSVSELVPKLESSQKARGVNLVINELSSQGLSVYASPNGKNFMANYDDQIIKMRNVLAHCQSVEIGEEGREVLKTNKADLTFDSETMIQIRRNIQTYHKLFDTIKYILSTVK